MGSIIELTPQILSSRFIDCTFEQDKNGNSFRMVDDAIFVYQGRAVVGVSADRATGFLVPDLKAEEEYRNPRPEMLGHLNMRREVTAAISGIFKRTKGNENVNFQFTHAGDLSPVPFSSIYPELLRQAGKMDVIPSTHPDYRLVKPGCDAIQDYLNRQNLPRLG